MAPRILSKTASLSIQNPSLLRAHPYLQGFSSKVQIGKARCLHSSAISTKHSSTTALGPAPNSHAHSHEHHAETGHASPEAFGIFQQLGEVGPATRYTVYAGLGLMVTVESTFWFHVLRAKLFPRPEEAQHGADEPSRRMSEAVGNIRRVCMVNYQRYHSAYVWGVGYGGLDDMDEEP